MEDERKALLERLEDVKRKVDEAAKEAGREELLDKAEVLPDDVRWHMIGHLQSNKAKQLVHRVFLQINTSEEVSKHGVDPDACVALAQHVVDSCPHLRLAGLMTIGKPDYTATPENFQCLVSCREAVCSSLGIPAEDIDLSMGMSSDYELAISLGSTNVRVGSTIFGARNRP
eukprot:jgi/Pico_ML_1/54957/g90.t1